MTAACLQLLCPSIAACFSASDGLSQLIVLVTLLESLFSHCLSQSEDKLHEANMSGAPPWLNAMDLATMPAGAASAFAKSQHPQPFIEPFARFLGDSLPMPCMV